MAFGQLDRAPAAFERGADGDDARYSCLVGPTQHVIESGSEVGVIEVRVSFDERLRLRFCLAFPPADRLKEILVPWILSQRAKRGVVLDPSSKLWTGIRQTAFE